MEANEVSKQWNYGFVTDLEWIRQYCHCTADFLDFQEKLYELLANTKCILDGHFEFTPDIHSRYFLRFSKITHYLVHIQVISNAVDRIIRAKGIQYNAVFSNAGPISSIAYDIAKKDKDEEDEKSLFLTTGNDIIFSGEREKKVLIILEELSEVSIRETFEIIEKEENTVVGVVILFQKKSEDASVFIPPEIPLIVMCNIDFPDVWEKSKCELCPDEAIPVNLMN
ncbi:MAG: hypothetical protein WCV41_01610 [Patescibacteria group bacterium]